MQNVTSIEKSSYVSADTHYGNTAYKNDNFVPSSGQDTSYVNKWFTSQWQIGKAYDIACKWEPLRAQILMQWARISTRELDEAGPNRGRLALLIHNRYGISAKLIENYLHNFERILPLA